MGLIILYPVITKNKGGNIMKAMTVSHQNFKPAIPYPNAATRRQVFHKVLDTVLITASGIAITVMLTFLLTIG